MAEKKEGLDQPKGQRKPAIRDVNGFKLYVLPSEGLFVPPVMRSATRNGKYITIEMPAVILSHRQQN